MTNNATHQESHHVHKIGWLRAAVLGANDGLVSTASLIVGVAAGDAEFNTVLLAGVAGLVAGAMAMAAGEFVSVSSQSDTENADLKKETAALRDTPEAELEELAQIYVDRGVDLGLARDVAAGGPAEWATLLIAFGMVRAGVNDALAIGAAVAALAGMRAAGL